MSISSHCDSRLTQQGRVFFWIAIFVLSCGLAFVHEALVLSSLLMLFSLVPIFLLNKFHFSKVDSSCDAINVLEAEKTFLVKLTFSNRGGSPCSHLSVQTKYRRDQADAEHQFHLKPLEKQQCTLSFRAPKRGVYQDLHVANLCSQKPFGLFRCRRKICSKGSSFVFPEVIKPKHFLDFISLTSQNRPSDRHHTSQGDFMGLRDFRSGDALKLINWKAMARHQKLVVSEYEPRFETEKPEIRLIFYHNYDSITKELAFEQSISELMGIISLLFESQMEFEFCSSWNEWKPLFSHIHQLDQFQRLLSSIKKHDPPHHSTAKQPSYGKGINIVISPEPFSRWGTAIKGRSAELYSVENQHLVKRDPT